MKPPLSKGGLEGFDAKERVLQGTGSPETITSRCLTKKGQENYPLTSRYLVSHACLFLVLVLMLLFVDLAASANPH